MNKLILLSLIIINISGCGSNVETKCVNNIMYVVATPNRAISFNGIAITMAKDKNNNPISCSN